MDPKHDLAHPVSLGEAPVELRDIYQRKSLRDRDLELGCLHGPIEAFELTHPGKWRRSAVWRAECELCNRRAH